MRWVVDDATAHSLVKAGNVTIVGPDIEPDADTTPETDESTPDSPPVKRGPGRPRKNF